MRSTVFPARCSPRAKRGALWLASGLLLAGTARASEPPPSSQAWEVSLGGTLFSLGDPSDKTQFGVGLRVGRGLAPHWSLEGGLTHFPSLRRDTLAGGSKWQLLAGLRAHTSGDGLRPFLRLRGGTLHYGEGRGRAGFLCVAIFPPPVDCLEGQWRPALDLGGGLEWRRPDAPLFLRLDVGGLWIRNNARSAPFFDPGWNARFQAWAGVGWRPGTRRPR